VAWYEWVCSSAQVPLDLIAYLRTSPVTAHGRLKRRARPEERPVDLQFIEVWDRITMIVSRYEYIILQDLHRSHEDWLVEQIHGPVRCPVLIIDADQEMPRVQSLPYHCLYFMAMMIVDMFVREMK